MSGCEERVPIKQLRNMEQRRSSCTLSSEVNITDPSLDRNINKEHNIHANGCAQRWMRDSKASQRYRQMTGGKRERQRRRGSVRLWRRTPAASGRDLASFPRCSQVEAIVACRTLWEQSSEDRKVALFQGWRAAGKTRSAKAADSDGRGSRPKVLHGMVFGQPRQSKAAVAHVPPHTIKHLSGRAGVSRFSYWV